MECSRRHSSNERNSMRKAVELVRGWNLTERFCPLRKSNSPAPPEMERKQKMKITTSVQSSFPRTIATKVLVLILLAMAAPAAVAQEVLFDSMSLPSAGEGAGVYGMGPMQG